MKKLLSWALVLCLCLAMLSTAALADGLYTPGTYTGESSGHEAGLTVTVTVGEGGSSERLLVTVKPVPISPSTPPDSKPSAENATSSTV